MGTRHVLINGAVCALLTGVPMVALCSDSQLSREEAGQAVAELVEYLGPLFECDISVISIEESSLEHPEIVLYHVTYDAAGDLCDEAHEALSHRGQSRGLLFVKPKDPTNANERPSEPNQDLIHETDPPMEM